VIARSQGFCEPVEDGDKETSTGPNSTFLAGMDKIVVANPVVELDGDEMTRIIWKVCIPLFLLQFTY
jgi:hypothetical protein